jgi:hypothetical protein
VFIRQRQLGVWPGIGSAEIALLKWQAFRITATGYYLAVRGRVPGIATNYLTRRMM